MKTKSQKRSEAKKNAEALKAQKKAIRTSKMNTMSMSSNSKKGKSSIPQSKGKK